MIHIVGGTYKETCLEPTWQELFGSGGRAAVALARLDNEIKLSTYIDSFNLSTLSITAHTFGFSFEYREIPRTISFDYHHCLSEPLIYPPVPLLEKNDPIIVEAENILRFGFLEGDAVVSGNKVVYDPQDAFNPQLFGANGSKAGRLVIVANFGECCKLVGKNYQQNEVNELAKVLLTKENAEVIVIKCGTLGAFVATYDEIQLIPPYKTNKVWSIGSGDVFAAVFAHYWMNEGVSPFDAASMASLATAYYCNSRVLPIPANFLSSVNFEPIVGKNEVAEEVKQVYLAGPFFTMAERWIIDQSKKYLTEQGFKVFSPLHDVGFGSAEQVVPKDIQAIHESELVFAIVDGLDSGTLFEIGYARSLNKPVIVFVQNESEESLKMLVGSGCEVVNDFVSAIYRTVWAALKI